MLLISALPQFAFEVFALLLETELLTKFLLQLFFAVFHGFCQLDVLSSQGRQLFQLLLMTQYLSLLVLYQFIHVEDLLLHISSAGFVNLHPL